jgi:hypothetical protein
MAIWSRLTLATALGSATVACSLTALEGFSGEGAALEDGAAPPEGGNEGGGGVEAAGPTVPFCEELSPKPAYCTDFEDGTIAAPFAAKSTGGGKSELVEPGNASKRAVGFTVGPVSGSGEKACLELRLPAVPNAALVVTVDARVVQVGFADFDVLTVAGEGGDQIGVSIMGSALRLEEDVVVDGSRSELDIETTATIGDAYKRIRLRLERSGDATSATLTVDGVVAASHLSAARALAQIEIQIGDCNIGAASNWHIHVDNVTVSTE